MSPDGVVSGFVTQAELNSIETSAISHLKFPDVLNQNVQNLIAVIDYDDLTWWVENPS